MTLDDGQTAVAGQIHILQQAGATVLRVTGAWTLPHYAALNRAITGLRLQGEPELRLDELRELDTAGATLLARLLGAERLCALAETAPGLSSERRALLQTVGAAVGHEAGVPATHPLRVREFIGRWGRWLEHAWRQSL